MYSQLPAGMVKMPCQTWSDTSKARWVDVQSGCQSPEQPSRDCMLPAIVTLAGAGVSEATAAAAHNDRKATPAVNGRDEAERERSASRMGWALLLPSVPWRRTM